MLETGIPVATWLDEPEEVIMIALHRVQEMREHRERESRGN